MQNCVFVLDTNKQVQAPCHPAAARLLLHEGKAAVYRRFPFTIILKTAKPDVTPQSVTLKIDPGSKMTGMALVQDDKVVFAAELEHRGEAIKTNLAKRSVIRQNRRQRKTRYRQARFDNRTKSQGWIAPSLKSRVDNIQTWFTRFFRLCNLQAVSMELVRFDTQLMQNAELSGVEYQQGELAGYEIREYLLEKWQRKCAYCGKENVPFEIEHIIPKSRGGSNRVSNLTLACHECNDKKDNQTAVEFGYPDIQAQAKQPLKDASAVNVTRWAVWRMLTATGLPVEIGTGGRTKFNRVNQGYGKAHWIDAACVGASGTNVKLDTVMQPLAIKAMGRGNRQIVNSDKYGFPRGKPKAAKRVFGFQTGDIIKAIVPKGKNTGTHTGRVAIRATGDFRVGKVDHISYRYCCLIQHIDGYNYNSVTIQ